MICVLLLGAGEEWERAALEVLGPVPDMTVLRRCMDVTDLLANAASGQAQAAVVGLATPGLDASAVRQLRDQGVLCLAVTDRPRDDSTQDRAHRLGVGQLVDVAELAGLPGILRGLPSPRLEYAPGLTPTSQRILTVWGPHGAPGRTTVAVALAAEWARRGRPVTLLDADPCAPAVGQVLGILEESSGLLAAVRQVRSGAPPQALARHLRRLEPHLDVLTGLPRPDRWNEVRTDELEQVLDLARQRSDVVLDTGAPLEEGAPSRPSRHAMTRQALAVADDVVVVGLADPVGLTRLVQGLAEVVEIAPSAHRHVVLNRMRPSLGWSADQVRQMLEPYLQAAPVHVLPDDRAAADRALAAGRSVVQDRRSPLGSALSRLVDALAPDGTTAARPHQGSAPESGRTQSGRAWVRRRTGSTARLR